MFISTYHRFYKESNKMLETAIKNLGGRDFEKKKLIISNDGIFSKQNWNYNT